ncbi:NAD(P)/FAD-dependent oxidoreductase [Spongiibacter marinus]|uniref:NAD(P)/FAD-dependent oxidoreductase n=1 Tax=Spongiibacter marinus TaxID=354246 RepID=UPI000403039F|nr:NAD(P)/FAD-dependent oxidoreductase [Spongiibacter marinus]
MTTKQRIAIIGSGISGLSCAWLLQRSGHAITVFEKDDRLGGHSNTVEISTTAGTTAVDTGFIVFNDKCYPNLVNLFKQLGVDSLATDMSFGVSLDDGRLEYSGSNSLATMFAQKRNLLRPRFWKMLADLLRFYRESENWMETLPDSMSLGELLKRERFGAGFCDDHLLPMGAAIWSTPVNQMLAYPAKTFLRFCQNHGLLQVKNRPTWRTVVGGSVEYVKRLAAPFEQHIKLNCGVSRVDRFEDHVIVVDDSGESHRFDQVVFGCHADQALAMLSQSSEAERKTLGAFRYEENRAVLHCDPRLLPKRPTVWSSWNYMGDRQQGETKVSVSYWMNALQHLPCAEPIVVSLNPLTEPRARHVFREFSYQHPVFDGKALAAQTDLWALQGQQRSWFCGSYFGYGFHEDGIQSGLAVAERLGGGLRPWQAKPEDDRINLPLPAEVSSSAA